MSNEELADAIRYARDNLYNLGPGPHWTTWHKHLEALLALQHERAKAIGGSNG